MSNSSLIFITGASGQVGSAMVRLAAETGVEVLGVGRRELDVSDPHEVSRVIREKRPAVVVNCAAYTDVDGAQGDPETAAAVNAGGPENLARSCRDAGIPLIHVSTDFVFDGTAGRPYREVDLPNPVNTYGRTKLDGEEAVRAVLDRHLIVRTSWVFAPRHANFVTTILRLAREREELRVVAYQTGSPTPGRALGEALLDLAVRAAAGEALAWGTYHLAGEPPASRFDLAVAAVEAARSSGMEMACRRILPVAIAEFPTRAPRPAYTALDCTRAQEVLGLARIAWEDSLGDMRLSEAPA